MESASKFWRRLESDPSFMGSFVRMALDSADCEEFLRGEGYEFSHAEFAKLVKRQLERGGGPDETGAGD
jgi:hypothetical protein